MNGSGPGGGSLFSSMLFHSFDDPNYPELQIFMTPMNIDENLSDGKNETTSILQSLGRKLLVRGKKVAKPGVQIDINLERPKSLGKIRLKSSNPLDYPIIDPNYLNNKKDLDDLVKGVKVVKKIMENVNIRKYLTEERGDWKNVSTDEEIISAIRKTAYTGHHPCSTAKMGMSNDIHSVVDKELKVFGVEGLRVCDASAMPSQITGNLYATVIAMAEKASDMILKLEKKTPLET
jgi:choline dehydrogenase